MPKPNGGSHGYDPEAPEMQALFIANGPDIRQGVTLPAFDNVDVYSLETKLLGIRGEPNDGSLRSFKAALY
jgi:predicted AlkP superfamily pyrophosphatase or phosphodiesterase